MSRFAQPLCPARGSTPCLATALRICSSALKYWLASSSTSIPQFMNLDCPSLDAVWYKAIGKPTQTNSMHRTLHGDCLPPHAGPFAAAGLGAGALGAAAALRRLHDEPGRGLGVPAVPPVSGHAPGAAPIGRPRQIRRPHQRGALTFALKLILKHVARRKGTQAYAPSLASTSGEAFADHAPGDAAAGRVHPGGGRPGEPDQVRQPPAPEGSQGPPFLLPFSPSQALAFRAAS